MVEITSLSAPAPIPPVTPQFGGVPANHRSAFWAVLAILLMSVAFGGGGSKYGLANLVVQLTALAALAFHRQAFLRFWNAAPMALSLLVALTILVPALYLIPLPSDIWSSMPGRELVAQSFDLIGGANWAPLSVDPVRTLLALTALITPLALLTIGWSASRDSLLLLGWVIVALGLANFALGIPQVLSGSEVGVLYPENPMPGVLFGTFANRNSTGLFLVAALALATILPAPPRFSQAQLPLRIGICVLLVVAILLTRSRTALVIAMLPLALAAVHFLRHRGASPSEGSKSKSKFIFAAIALAVAFAAVLAFAAPGRVNDVFERFSNDEDARSYIWEDAAYSADRYWPVGSGMGTFDDVFQVDESLENMTLRKAGRAHNDYLEVAIEAGLPGIALILFWLALAFWLSWRARKEPGRWIAWFGGVILLTVALQSITDYPLRNMSMLAVSSYALLILARFGSAPTPPPKQEVLT